MSSMLFLGLKNWSTIAKHLPGRTDNKCRRRWYVLMKNDPKVSFASTLVFCRKIKLKEFQWHLICGFSIWLLSSLPTSIHQSEAWW